VFTTARWSPLSRFDVAVFDIQTGVVRQLTATDAADAYPAWSPDGSRIAFSRNSFDGASPAVCTIGADGSEPRCRTFESDNPPIVLGWVDAERVVVQRDSGGVRLWDVLEPDTWLRTPLGSSRGGQGRLSPDGAWMLARGALPGAAGQQWYVFPVDRPAAHRVVTADLPDEVQLLWAASPRPPRYLTELRVRVPSGTLPLNAPYQLRVAGVSADGAPIPVHFVRWHSADTTVAVIDSAGVLRPRREGRVALIASAGGWRADTVEIEIAARSSTPVIDESWQQGIGTHWVPWGTPLPVLEPLSASDSALLTRGDSSFDSGLYSRVTIPAAEGIGVEAAITGARSALQWQRHSLQLDAALDSAWLAGWDHRTGGLDPQQPDPRARCWVSSPAVEGAAGVGRVGFGCGALGVSAPSPSDLDDGNWHRMRLQLLPDGRLGVAIDGIPIGITGVPARLDRPFRVVISGQSHGARLLVGEVRVWTGVRDDIDWR
jgi:hypothetical protein